jgi:hypothetical protein
MKFKIGDKVKTLVDCEPYYSGYAGNPIVKIPKGTIGEIGAVKVPYVNRQGFFNCVDFVIPNVFSGNPKFKQNIWRASLTDKEIKIVK